MKIVKVDFVQSGRTGSLASSMSEAEISKVLGFEAEQYSEDDGDGKVTREWNFKIGDKEFSIWDYKGARWSTFGDSSTLILLFGTRYTVQRY